MMQAVILATSFNRAQNFITAARRCQTPTFSPRAFFTTSFTVADCCRTAPSYHADTDRAIQRQKLEGAGTPADKICA